MRIGLALLVSAFSPFASASSISVLSARAGLPGYSVQDRHDELALALIDVLSEMEIDRVDTPMKKIRLARLESVLVGGSIPLAKVLEARWEIESDEVRDSGRAEHAQAIRQKMASLEALAAGKTEVFLGADVRSNEAYLRHFEAELNAARVDEKYWEDRFTRVYKLSNSGAEAVASAHEVERQLKKARVFVATWQAKCDEQTKQLAASRVAFGKAKTSKP